MQRVKPKILIFLILESLFIYIVFMFTGCLITLAYLTTPQKDYNEVFLSNWGIELPDNMEEKFRKSEDNWYGEGVRYALFGLKADPVNLIEDFQKEKNADFENEVDKRLSEATFNIDEKYLPVWEAEYYWNRIDEYMDKEYNSEITEKHCYMVYFTKTMELAICQYYY